LFNLARAEQLTGRDLEAYDHYRQFLAFGDDPKVGEAQRERAREHVAELEKKLGHIDVEAPAAARVTVDGKPVEDRAQTVTVVPGRHVVEATLGDKVKSTSVESAAGATVKATLAFESDPGDSSITGSATPPPTEGDRGSSTTRYAVAGPRAALRLAGCGAGVGFALGASSGASDA